MPIKQIVVTLIYLPPALRRRLVVLREPVINIDEQLLYFGEEASNFEEPL